ncbi:COG3650 family protein [Floridanema evergladense]|uniref:COG3650 family protein n=1 Tax=Floridaenema evergladense BLCC-F167 TaxID=3153639 RepID=A0ABV4WHR2_9CYAN
MKSLCFYSAILALSVSCLGSDAALADRQGNRNYVNNNISRENLLISQTPAKVETFTAIGTEPFWNITINRNGIVYSSPDASKRIYPYVAPIAAQARSVDFVRVYRLNGQPNGTLIIKKVKSCSDGMSDKAYPYEAILILGNQVMEGCASRN